jgi:hypothetical protein
MSKRKGYPMLHMARAVFAILVYAFLGGCMYSEQPLLKNAEVVPNITGTYRGFYDGDLVNIPVTGAGPNYGFRLPVRARTGTVSRVLVPATLHRLPDTPYYIMQYVPPGRHKAEKARWYYALIYFAKWGGSNADRPKYYLLMRDLGGLDVKTSSEEEVIAEAQRASSNFLVEGVINPFLRIKN